MTAGERLASELARRWPLGVCLVVDDLHHLTSHTDGRRLVIALWRGRCLEDARYGGTVCGTNDELEKWTVNLHPFASAAITSVKVTIERFDGSPPPGVWVAVASRGRGHDGARVAPVNPDRWPGRAVLSSRFRVEERAVRGVRAAMSVLGRNGWTSRAEG